MSEKEVRHHQKLLRTILDIISALIFAILRKEKLKSKIQTRFFSFNFHAAPR